MFCKIAIFSVFPFVLLLGIANVCFGQELETKLADFWFSSGQYVSGEKFSIHGPKILRSRGRPAFVWQVNSAVDWGVKSKIPYVLVLKNQDSMNLLTAFSSMPIDSGTRVGTNGRFQCDDFSGIFEYAFGTDDPIGSPAKIRETFTFHLADGDHEFDLDNGRVFVIEKSATQNKFVLTQLDYKLPQKSTFRSVEKIKVDMAASYRLFGDWLERQAANRKKVPGTAKRNS